MLDASVMIGIGRPEEKSPVVLRKVYLRAGVDVSMQGVRFILVQYWDGSVCPHSLLFFLFFVLGLDTVCPPCVTGAQV